MKWDFRHIHEYYSPQNISTIKHSLMKNAQKTKMTTSRRTSRGPPGIIDARARYRAAARRLRNTGICHTGSGWNCVPSWSCSQAVSNPLWHIPLLCVQCKTPDDGQSNCPKHVEFYSKNKFEKLVHLAGFIARNVVNIFIFSTIGHILKVISFVR